MGLVRGRDSTVGAEHSDGATAGGAVGTYAPYPLITFDHKIDALPLEESPELLAQGARETVPPSQKQIVGTMVLRPRFDDNAFLKILANAIGGTEVRNVNRSVRNSSAGQFIGCIAHYVDAGGEQPRQWLRVNLGTAGLRIDSTCKFSKMVWEHVSRATPRLSVDVLGIGPTAGSAAALALHKGVSPLNAKSLDDDGGWTWLEWRPSPGDSNWVAMPNITSFKITLDHQMEQVGTYIDSPSTFSELGAGEKTRLVEVEFEGEMPEGLDSTEDHPYYHYANGTAFGFEVTYASVENQGGSASQYQIRHFLPNLVPVDGSLAVAGPGVLKWTVKAVAEASTELRVIDFPTPTGGTDYRVVWSVDAADEALIVNSSPYYCHQHA
jgi:hypothetical protein